MKKILMALLISSVLLLPAGGTVLAGHEEAPAPIQEQPDVSAEAVTVQEHVPGGVPAETGPVESMSPALHALVLALVDRDAVRFDRDDSGLAWEGLYGMLSLYGQMDSRAEPRDGVILLPAETVQDYAAALDLDLDKLGAPPRSLEDRITYSAKTGTYRVVCGEDGLAQIEVDRVSASGGGLQLTGALVYQVDGRALARFRADLQPRDNMFGYCVAGLELTD